MQFAFFSTIFYALLRVIVPFEQYTLVIEKLWSQPRLALSNFTHSLVVPLNLTVCSESQLIIADEPNFWIVDHILIDFK